MDADAEILSGELATYGQLDAIVGKHSNHQVDVGGWVRGGVLLLTGENVGAPNAVGTHGRHSACGESPLQMGAAAKAVRPVLADTVVADWDTGEPACRTSRVGS